jgi:serine/threonine-protein kinase
MSDADETLPESEVEPLAASGSSAASPSVEACGVGGTSTGAAERDALDVLPERVGPYAVRCRIARGGMGDVLAVRDHRFDRELALKRLDPWPCAPHLEACFEAELRISAKLQHPSIVPVHDHGRDGDGRPYFVMPLIHGETLASLLSRDAVGPLEARLDVFTKVCEAVSFAHRRDVLHLDLKPANVLVGEGGAVYVLDWGIADDGDNELALGLGTPRYMAPEQRRAQRDALGPPTDVFALGALLFGLATLTPVRWCERDGLSWPEGGDAPPRLRAICERATATDPRARYPSVDDLLGDVRQLFVVRSRVMMVRRHVPLAVVDEYERWVRGVVEVSSRFAGHQGATLLRGAADATRGTREYLMIVRFASDAALEAWDRSPERAAWVAEADRLSGGPAIRRDASGPEAWFDVDLG